MDLTQVEIALSVARNGSFSAAARELSYSQSTISKRIDALEKEIGLRIFERRGRSQLALTEEGAALVPEFEALEEAHGQLRSRIEGLNAAFSHSLRLGIVDGLSTFGEDELAIAFEESHPHIAIEQKLGKMTRLFQLLRSRQIDAAIVPFLDSIEREEYEEGNGNIVFHDMWDLSLKIAVRSDHPAIVDGEIALSSLKDETFLFRSFHKSSQDDRKIQRFVRACESEGFEPNVQLSTNRKTMVFNMVATGQCVAPLMFRPRILMNGIVVVPLDKRYYSFSVKLVYLRDNGNKALPVFLDFLDRWLASSGKKMR